MKGTKKQADIIHLNMVNRLIAAMNGMLAQGIPCDEVASAGVAAAAAFTAFNLSENYKKPLLASEVTEVARQFTDRMLAAATEQRAEVSNG